MSGRLRAGSAMTRRRFLKISCLGDGNKRAHRFRSTGLQPLSATANYYAWGAVR